MARIRTIKPDFPHSESMGRVSREARLCFILLWTMADDEGRLRGNSRMVASLLYPFDDDVGKLMPEWLRELEAEGCIVCYQIERDSYIQISNWLKHQKIDKPYPSKLPSPEEHSRTFANGRDNSPTYWNGMEGNGSGREEGSAPKAPPLQQAIDVWNSMAKESNLPIVQRLTKTRSAKLKTRLIECGGIEGWETACEKVKGSAFLTGKNDRGWRADFDFMLQQKSFTKLMEGGYDRSEPHHAFGNGFAAIAVGKDS